MKKRLHQMEQETSTMQGDGMDMTMDEDGTVNTSSSNAPPDTAAEGTQQQQQQQQQMGGAGGAGMVDEAMAESDSRSIYVGNVSNYYCD